MSNLEVNAIKQAFVDSLITELRKIDAVCGLILFGSVLTDTCTEDSDVDMFIVCADVRTNAKLSKQISDAVYTALKVQYTETDIMFIDTFDEFFAKNTMLTRQLVTNNTYKIMY